MKQLIFAIVLSSVCAWPMFSQASVFINEVHYDNAGVDAGEAIEIAGSAGTDLAGYTLVLYNGSTGLAYNTIALSGVIPNQRDSFGVLVFYVNTGIQNGSPDGLALVGPSNNVIQFLSYEGAFIANEGPANGMQSTDIGIFEDFNTPPGYSLQNTGLEAGSKWFGPVPHTFGLLNKAPTVFINEIHYDNAGVDAGEAIELAGSAGTDLAGYSLVLYNGNNGFVYDTIALSGRIPYQKKGFGVLVFYVNTGIQNGSPDGLALVGPSNNVIQFLSYEGKFFHCQTRGRLMVCNQPISGFSNILIPPRAIPYRAPAWRLCQNGPAHLRIPLGS